MTTGAFRVKRDRNEILQELFESKEKTNVLGFYLKGEHKLITTAVVDIGFSEVSEPVIQLRECDLHGYPLFKSQIPLSEIDGVIRFNTLYNDPVYVRIREMKNRINSELAA
ncbi:hypothetical protein [Chryseosolibacter indicus]|uniref:PilZ domain-containing protein n=1 Tax=Chryseosolibacter indicus TaxID=2782351 RepID=A0ABS5VRT0_9BACT|nr:hypothetical protein [Chryseosolibacter indicus]MBT1703474.1 hypothetical protein [Chryseosolibacter indicus]